MKLFNFFKLFKFSKKQEPQFIEVISPEQLELEDALVQKIKEWRFEFVDEMFENGFTPSQKLKSQLQDMLLLEIFKHRTTNLNNSGHFYRHIVQDLDSNEYLTSKVFKNGISDDCECNQAYENMYQFFNLALKHDVIDMEFFNKSQNIKDYLKPNFREIVDNYFRNVKFISRDLGSYHAYMVDHINSCVNLNITDNINHRYANTEYPKSMFSLALDITGATREDIRKALNAEDGNVLLALNNKLFDLPLDVLLKMKDKDANKEFFKETLNLNNNEEMNAYDWASSYGNGVTMLLGAITVKVLKKDIESGKVLPESILKECLTIENSKKKELIFLVVQHYPESLKKIDKEDAIEILSCLDAHIDKIHEASFKYSETKRVIKNYIKDLRTNVLKQGEDSILQKIGSVKQEELEKNNDYVSFAKSLKLDSQLINILKIIEQEFTSLRVLNLNIDKSHTVDGLESSLVKSLKIYSELKDLDKETDTKGLVDSFKTVLQSLQVIKDEEMRNTINSLNVSHNVHKRIMRQ